MRLLITILSLLLSVSTDKLNDQENIKRLEECGKSNRTWKIVDWNAGDYWPPWPFKTVPQQRHKRVSNGEQVSSHEAPWVVLVNFTAQDSNLTARPHWTSGNMISRRHILTDSTVLLERKHNWVPVEFSWKWRFNGSMANVSNCLTTGFLEAPEEAVKYMFIRVCKKTQVCEAGKPYPVKRAWYVGLCHEKMESYGFSLLELSTNMTDPHAFHRLSPVCLPPEDLKMNTLDPLRLYALGPRNEKEYGEHVAEDRFYTDIRRGDTVVRSCFEDDGEPHYAYSHGSICLDSNVCGGDIGAAFVKEMEGGRMVAVAIARNGRCGYNRSQPQPAVHIFLTQICNLAGICHVDLNSTLSETSTLPTIISEPIDTTRRTTQKLSDKATTDKSADRTTTDKSIDITTDKPTDKPITESIKTTEDQYAEKPQFHRHATMLKGHKRTEKYQLFWIFMIFMIFLWI